MDDNNIWNNIGTPRNKFDSIFDNDPFFKNNNQQYRDDSFDNFHDNFVTTQKIFFVIFGIVLTFIICMFIFVIFTICFRICKGESFQDYRRQRRGQTIIPPPPPFINPCNYYLFFSKQMIPFFNFTTVFLLKLEHLLCCVCAVNALGETCFAFFSVLL